MYQLSEPGGSADRYKGPVFGPGDSQVPLTNIRPRSLAALRASARLGGLLSASSLCTHSTLL